ncbi:hypothetical protein BC834DRAFT_160126 [Gloeopeniophorella convolvens]|nr:hypothetical protein BC834DRAFT_160126 [Gloeopeniophorella convolvens]
MCRFLPWPDSVLVHDHYHQHLNPNPQCTEYVYWVRCAPHLKPPAPVSKDGNALRPCVCRIPSRWHDRISRASRAAGGPTHCSKLPSLFPKHPSRSRRGAVHISSTVAASLTPSRARHASPQPPTRNPMEAPLAKSI